MAEEIMKIDIMVKMYELNILFFFKINKNKVSGKKVTRIMLRHPNKNPTKYFLFFEL